MSLQIYINDVDKSALVNWSSVQFEDNLTSQVDLLSFDVRVYDGQAYAPAVLDHIELYDDSVKIFGGHIVAIDRTVTAGSLITYNVKTKDYSHYFDRRLVVDEYEDLPAINIICEILNRYVNKGLRVQIADFEPTEIWTGGAADAVNYRTGAQGWKVTSVDTVAATAYRDIFLNLTPSGFDDATDIIEADVWIDDIAALDTVILKAGDGDLTNNFSYSITGLVTGANLVRVAKSGFTATGAPDWSAINRVQVEVTSTAGNTANVTFDNWQAMTADAFTRINAMTATGTVKFAGFRYEQPTQCLKQLAELFNWNWYIDENRDVNFFAKFEQSSAFNLTDTAGKHIYDSLQYKGDAKQLRNSIYVRGGDYLASAYTEYLTQQTDGDNAVFLLGYRYKNYSLTVDGDEVSVGVANLQSYTGNSGESQLSGGGTGLNIGETTGNERQALQIICGKKGRRSGVRLKIKKVGAPTDNLVIRIYSSSGNEPTATPLSAAETIAGGDLTTDYVETTVDFTESATNDLLLDVEDKYHIVLSRSTGVDASNYYVIDATSQKYDGLTQAYDGMAWVAESASAYFSELIKYEVLYSFNEKQIIFTTAPAAGAVIVWQGQPYLPVIIQYKDYASIAIYGEYQHKIIDSSIKTKEGARQRALAEILEFASEIQELQFDTYNAGLKSGQTINVDLSGMSVDGDYIITRVRANTRTHDSFLYGITAVSTRTFGIIDWLTKQLEDDAKNIEISADEVVDKIEGILEAMTMSESWTATLLNGHVWAADDTTPNRLIWNGGASQIWI